MNEYAEHYLSTPRPLERPTRPEITPFSAAVLFLWVKCVAFNTYVLDNLRETWCNVLASVFLRTRSHEKRDLRPFLRSIEVQEPPADFFDCIRSLLPLIADREFRKRAHRSMDPLVVVRTQCLQCRYMDVRQKRTQVWRFNGVLHMDQVIAEYERERQLVGGCPRDNTHTVRQTNELQPAHSKGFWINTCLAVLRGSLGNVAKGGTQYFPSVVITRSPEDGTHFFYAPQRTMAYIRCGRKIEEMPPLIGEIIAIYYETITMGHIDSATPPRRPNRALPIRGTDSNSDSDEEIEVARGSPQPRPAHTPAVRFRERSRSPGTADVVAFNITVDTDSDNDQPAAAPSPAPRPRRRAPRPLPPPAPIAVDVPPRRLRGPFIRIPTHLRGRVLQELANDPEYSATRPDNPQDNTARNNAYARITAWLHAEGHNVRPDAVRMTAIYERAKQRKKQ